MALSPASPAANTAEFRRQVGMGYRTAPAAVVTDALGAGTLDLTAAPLRRLSNRRVKFTVTSPYMLAKVLLDRQYGDRHALGMALADVLREQVSLFPAGSVDVLQVDEANLAGAPEDAHLRRRTDQPRAGRRPRRH